MARLTPAVVRTLDILELFLQGPESLAATDVIKATGLPRSTAHELLTTLTARGYLVKNENTGRYSLGVNLLHLGNAYAARFDLLGAANGVARELSERTDETASVAIRQGSLAFYLAKIERRPLIAIPSSIGQRLPASCTSVGKALLSALTDEQLASLYPEPDSLPMMTERSRPTLTALMPDLIEARARGYAVEHGESNFGLNCVGALVHDATGTPVAAISISLPETRWRQ
ncbi:MAG: IclR family transcriptional regulator, partial [Propioniciclava sp.]